MCNKPRVHACQQCGTGFTDRKRKYCSDDCYRAAALRRRRLPQASKNCLRCGQEFHSNKRKYCSFACYYETSLERTSIRNKENVDEFVKARDMNSELVEQTNIEAANIELAKIAAEPHATPPTWDALRELDQLHDDNNDLKEQVQRLQRENERAWLVVDALIAKHKENK